MIQSLYAGVSGLQSFQTGIDVLANNIANINTVGFKGSSTEFSNMFEKAVSTSGNSKTSMQSGSGVQVNATALDMSIGSIYKSDNITDLAISGNDGWFGLTGPNDTSYFTRAGNFRYDPYLPGATVNQSESLQRLVNPDGYLVLGTSVNNFTFDPAYIYSDGDALNPAGPVGAYVLNEDVKSIDLADVTAQGPLDLPVKFAYLPVATTTASFFGNLGTEDVPRTISAEAITSDGDRNNLRLLFTQTVPQPATGISWDISATVATTNYDPVNGIGTLYDTQTGTALFDSQGRLISPPLAVLDNNGSPVTVDLGNGFTGLISNDGPSVTSYSTHDGTVGGELNGYSFSRNGDIVASFSNGKSSLIGKVAVYHFQNDQGLEVAGGNNFRASANSGKPIFYAKDNGQILSGNLENSNVSLEVALTQLIIMQRSYDATSKTITTSDEMLKNALQM